MRTASKSRWTGGTAAFRERKEVRSFHKIRRSNSGRILNLIALSETAGRAPEVKRGKLFHSNALNFSILIKHNVREHERELFQRNVHVATKVFIPFDSKRLESGGRSFFLEEDQFKDHLKDIAHIDAHALDPEVQHDLKVLDAISHCPTLDAFIVTECLRSEGIGVEIAYLSENYALANKTSTDVFQVFKPLLEKALGKVASPEEMSRFIDQVWNVNAATTSNLFLEALQIPRAEWANVIFAWKALIYYDLISRGTGERLEYVLKVLHGTIPRARPSSPLAFNIAELKRDLARQLFNLHDGSTGYIRLALKKVVDAILSDSGAVALSESLRDMAANITKVGTNVVLFDQVTSYLLYLYPRPSPACVDPDELENQLANLCDIVRLRDKTISTGSELVAGQQQAGL